MEKGEGKPLILLHGFMCSKEYFASQVNYFSKNFKVVAYDLYGFGENIPVEYAYNLTDYANEFINLASEYGEKVSVIAHSFGCRVVLKSMQLKPDLIEKAVLCGVAGLKPPFNFKTYLKRIAHKITRPILTVEKSEKLFFSPDYNLVTGVMKESFKLVTSEYLNGVLPSIKAPVFAVFGEKDRQTPPKIGDQLVKNIPDCGKYVMKRCGHFCYAERPAEFNHVVREFLV